MKKLVSLIAGLVLTASMVQAQTIPQVDPAKVQGSIVTAGSSTVGPLSIALVERFRSQGFTGQITTDIIGSGAGFTRFAAGETDISNASAKMKDADRARATGIGREPIEFVIATDALAICVASSNTFANDMTTAEVAQAFSTAVYWSDIRADWPRQRILKYSPGTDSGTYDYFTEHFHNKNKQRILQSTNIQFSENDNVLVRGIQRSQYAIGYFGFAYYQQARGLRALKINGVEPNAETVAAGTYSVARPLFLYSAASIMKAKPQVAAFLAYYFANVNELVRRVGYFPVTDAVMATNRQKWLTAMGSTATPWAK